MKNIIYYDLKTKRIKTAYHVIFDEGMNDLKTPTPNARRLRQALGRPVPAEETEEVAPKEFSLDATNIPFLELEDVTVNIKCDGPTLGIETEECPARRRGYIYDVKKGSSFSKVRGWKKKYRGAYIV